MKEILFKAKRKDNGKWIESWTPVLKGCNWRVKDIKVTGNIHDNK